MTRDGKTALSHWKVNPTTVQIAGTDIAYYFVPKNNVCMAWVNNEHVDKLLSIMDKGCSCSDGMTKPKFMITSDINVSLHETGHLP